MKAVKLLVVLPILAILILATAATAYATPNGNGSGHNFQVNGEVDLPEDGKIRDVHIVDTTGDDPSSGYTPALDTRGNATVRGLLIENASVGVRSGNGQAGLQSYQYRFRDNIIQGDGTNTALLLDVPLGDGSRIVGNAFVNQKCGISISVDVVFHDVPPEDRIAAFEKLAKQLEKRNRFENVAEPVCGVRG